MQLYRDGHTEMKTLRNYIKIKQVNEIVLTM